MVWHAPHVPSCRWLVTSHLSSGMTLLPCHLGSSCRLHNQPGRSISHIAHRHCRKVWESNHRLVWWAVRKAWKSYHRLIWWAVWLLPQTPHLRTCRRRWDREGAVWDRKPPQCPPHWWPLSDGMEELLYLMHAVFHCSVITRLVTIKWLLRVKGSNLPHERRRSAE